MKKGLVHLIFPLIIYAVVFWAFYNSQESYDFWVSSDTSMLEIISALPLIGALIVLGMLWAHPSMRGNKKIRPWLAAYTFAVFYFLGEDQNWGQHYIGWGTPDFFMAHNKEHETNLHNISPWFNQRPRLVMEIWLITAGILVPLGWSKPKEWLARWVPESLWPSVTTVPLAILTVGVFYIKRAEDHLGQIFDSGWGGSIRFSELQELGYAYFMMLYAILLYRRITSGNPKADI